MKLSRYKKTLGAACLLGLLTLCGCGPQEKPPETPPSLPPAPPPPPDSPEARRYKQGGGYTGPKAGSATPGSGGATK